jgi:NADP-dependent 3-hydroxy acid dehydrogenase YdfG
MTQFRPPRVACGWSATDEAGVTNIETGLTRSELGNRIANTSHSEQLVAMFDTVGGLTPDEVADVIGYITNLPVHMSLSQIVVVPTRA